MPHVLCYSVHERNRRYKRTGPGTLAPIAKDRLGYLSPESAAVETNTAGMWADFVVSTINQDRDGDVVVPEGCLPTIQNYTRNPVVFFNHQMYPLPVGKAEGPDGKLSLNVEAGKRIRSRVYFSQRSQDAQDVFALVDERILRMASIGFQPIEAERLGETDKSAKQGKRIPGWLVKLWDFLEWSIVGVPSNPFAEAVRRYISRGRISGKNISPLLTKALEPLASPITVWSNGSDLMSKKWGKGKKAPVKIKAEPPPDETPDEETKSPAMDVQEVRLSKEQFPTEEEAVAWLTEQVMESTVTDGGDAWIATQFPAEQLTGESSEEELGDGITATVGVRQVEPPVEEEPPVDAEKTEEIDEAPPEEAPPELEDDLLGGDLEEKVKPGVGFVRAVYALLDECEAMQENPDVQEACQMLREMADGLAATHYPEEAKADEGAETDEEVEPEKRFHKFKTSWGKGRLSKRHKAVMSECRDYLADASEDESLPKKFKSAHKYHVRELDDAMREADTPTVEDETADDEPEEKAVVISLASELAESTTVAKSLKRICGR